MNVIIITTRAESRFYFLTTTECSVEAFLGMFTCFLFGYLNNQHVSRITNDVIDNPAINEADRFPGSGRPDKYYGIVFPGGQTVHRFDNVRGQIGVPGNGVTRPHRHTHICTDRVGHLHTTRGS